MRIRAARVFTPRNISQHSNGDKIAPAAFCRNANFSACSGRVHTTTPPNPSLCPFRNFVVECTTMSAPSAMGCWKYGDMNVLSTTRSTFPFRQTALTARMSVNAINGLVGVSMNTMRVFFFSARSTFSATDLSA
jgi:hypothetical protein